MVNIYLYDTHKELFSLEFKRPESGLMVVCPGPVIADDIREKVQHFPDVEVTTLSNFLQQELGTVEEEFTYKSKSQLMTYLATVWKQMGQELNFEVFSQSYQLFTELRSYTLDLEVIDEILVHYDEKLQYAIKVFWRVLEDTKILDEHGIYRAVADLHRGQLDDFDELKERQIALWGFTHLSAVQLDFLNALGIRNNITVPFPKHVYANSKPGDWIRWLAPELDYELNESTLNGCLNMVRFSKNRLAETIFSMREGLSQGYEAFVGQKNPSLEELNEVTLPNSYFKAPIELFMDIHGECFLKIRKDIFGKDISKLPTTDILEFLERMKDYELDKVDGERNFRALKIYALLSLRIKEWQELSEGNEEMTLFDLRILQETSRLDLPRNYLTSLTPADAQKVRGIESLWGSDDNKKTILCITSEHSTFSGANSDFPEQVVNILISLGPMKGRELEVALAKDHVLKILSKPETILFMEKGLEDHNIVWNELLTLFSQIADSKVERNKNEKQDVLVAKVNEKVECLTPYSASKLQTFIDCPRKFYFSYVHKISINSGSSKVLEPRHLGKIEHKVIEKYFKEDLKDIANLSERVLDYYIAELKLNLSELTKKKYLEEIIGYSTNGINFLLNLKECGELPGLEFSFEEKLIKYNPNISGEVDCILKWDGGSGVIDFKRSAGSIPSQKSIKEYSKIQLPFYMLHAQLGAVGLWGYFNLSEPKDSLVFVQDKELQKSLKNHQLPSVKGPTFYKEDIGQFIAEYRDFEEDLTSKILSEQKFSPLPVEDKVCGFCSVSAICPRGEV